MKAADRLTQMLGANIDESMGANRPAGGAGGMFPGAIPGAVHGGPAKYEGAARIKDALAIDLERIIPDPDQPRQEFDPRALDDLAASLKARGQLQPARVRWSEAAGKWVIVSGERRWRAARMAGLATLACVEAKGDPSPDDILEDQIVENCIREDLRPIEQARAFRALIDRRGYSYRQLADALHVSHQAVVRAIALLTLPEDLQQQVDSGAVPASAAAEVAKIEDDATRRELVGRIAAGEMTRDEAVEEVRRATGRSSKGVGQKGRGAKPGPPRPRTFRTAIGKVTVEPKRDGSDDAVLAALREAVAMVEGRRSTVDQAAA